MGMVLRITARKYRCGGVYQDDGVKNVAGS